MKQRFMGGGMARIPKLLLGVFAMTYMLMATNTPIYQSGDLFFKESVNRYFDGGGQTYINDIPVKGNISDIKSIKVKTYAVVPDNPGRWQEDIFDMKTLTSGFANHLVRRSDNNEGYCYLYLNLVQISPTVARLTRKCGVFNGRHMNFYELQLSVI